MRRGAFGKERRESVCADCGRRLFGYMCVPVKCQECFGRNSYPDRPVMHWLDELFTNVPQWSPEGADEEAWRNRPV